jgi:replicative DNA helicase
MRPPARAERWSLTEQTGAIAGDLKDVAKDLGVPLFAACQLNRDVESRRDKRPTLADLRQSGRIEEVANKALLLYRADYYDSRAPSGVAEITIAKNRGGVSGRRVEVSWRPDCQRFGNLARPDSTP